MTPAVSSDSHPAGAVSPGGPPVFAVLAAGGTGGHVQPALAVARALVARGHDPATLRFVGSERGIDRDVVPEAGFALDALPGRGIERRVSLSAVLAAAEIVRAVLRAIILVRRLRPRVVVTFGGYAAVPCTVAAVLWRIPIVVVARDARAGAADRLAGRFAKACAVPFAATDLPRAVVTGNLVRPQVLEVDRRADRPAARRALSLPPDAVVVGVYSGALGSRRINQAVVALAQRWAGRHDVAVRHVTGRRDWEDLRPAVEELEAAAAAGGLLYQGLPYDDHVEQLLAASDVIVSRAGGATVAELMAVGLGAVLVPLPIATRDHQTANARVLVDAGAAVLVPDDELDTDRLQAELEPLVAQPERLEAMAARARALSRPDAAERVAGLVEEHAR